jgi:hypothetical protein
MMVLSLNPMRKGSSEKQEEPKAANLRLKENLGRATNERERQAGVTQPHRSSNTSESIRAGLDLKHPKINPLLNPKSTSWWMIFDILIGKLRLRKLIMLMITQSKGEMCHDQYPKLHTRS